MMKIYIYSFIIPYIKHPEKFRYNVIGVEMKGMESSMKLVALGAKVSHIW